MYKEQIIEQDTWRHYPSLSHWWESIWIMRRSTCQAWLSWHMDCGPNTYIHLKGERETQRDTHCAGRYTCIFLFKIYLRARIDSCQRGVCTVYCISHRPSSRVAAAPRWDSSLSQGHRFKICHLKNLLHIMSSGERFYLKALHCEVSLFLGFGVVFFCSRDDPTAH